ncbi:hypothetical protein [Olivibacter sp. XZL3]|uniref:hypothetical protein n=1 Tax=Olivibacter sp. XZL3 TaxID=1735116 RepID=UPI0010651ABA|nr:hypothetical protein [Olivibacter sp. XZL3]
MSTTEEMASLIEKLDTEQRAITAHFIKNMEAGAIAPDFIARAMDFIHRHYTDYLLRDDDYCTSSDDAERLLLLKDLFSGRELI